MCVGSLAGVTYLRYTVLTSANKSETAVHFCDPALSVLVMLVSRNVFRVVSALQSFASIGFSARANRLKNLNVFPCNSEVGHAQLFYFLGNKIAVDPKEKRFSGIR